MILWFHIKFNKKFKSLLEQGMEARIRFPKTFCPILESLIVEDPEINQSLLDLKNNAWEKHLQFAKIYKMMLNKVYSFNKEDRQWAQNKLDHYRNEATYYYNQFNFYDFIVQAMNNKRKLLIYKFFKKMS